MRLIDADALNKELQKRLGSPTDDKLYEVNLCIINAPTIDAIPVEWISAYMNKSYGRVRAEIIREMLDAWMEQEAR